jgi:hypothetical protein
MKFVSSRKGPTPTGTPSATAISMRSVASARQRLTKPIVEEARARATLVETVVAMRRIWRRMRASDYARRRSVMPSGARKCPVGGDCGGGGDGADDCGAGEASGGGAASDEGAAKEELATLPPNRTGPPSSSTGERSTLATAARGESGAGARATAAAAPVAALSAPRAGGAPARRASILSGAERNQRLSGGR